MEVLDSKVLDSIKQSPSYIYFFPEIFRLNIDLDKLKQQLSSANKARKKQIVLCSNSSLLLVAVPILISMKNYLKVQLRLDTPIEENQRGFMSQVQKNKKLQDLLETARVLQSHGISISFHEGVPAPVPTPCM